MAVLFAVVLLAGIAGLVVLPGVWGLVFGSLAGLSFLGLGVTGYAIGTNDSSH